jgi:hypothetical protein
MVSEEPPQIPADADSSHGKIDLSSSEKLPSEDLSVKGDAPEDTFPEGGARAWCVAAGTAGVTFCTLGYLNSFGYAPPHATPHAAHVVLLTSDSIFQAYYETHQLRDMSPSTIAWIGSLQAFFVFAGGLIGGPLFDRYGAKVCSYSQTLSKGLLI